MNSEMRSRALRHSIAVAGLIALGVLLVIAGTADRASFSLGRGPASAFLLLGPVALGAIGLGLRRDWGFWLGLAIGLAAAPWSFVLAFLSGPGGHALAGRVALAAAVLILVGLAGGGQITVGAGTTKSTRDPRRSRWLRWSIIATLASVLNLYAFVAAYAFRLRPDLVLLGLLLAGLLIGVMLLARRRTVGLPLLWLCCVLLVPFGVWFVWREAASGGEAVLFAIVLAPGLITGWVTIALFGRPVLSVMRSD